MERFEIRGHLAAPIGMMSGGITIPQGETKALLHFDRTSGQLTWASSDGRGGFDSAGALRLEGNGTLDATQVRHFAHGGTDWLVGTNFDQGGFSLEKHIPAQPVMVDNVAQGHLIVEVEDLLVAVGVIGESAERPAVGIGAVGHVDEAKADIAALRHIDETDARTLRPEVYRLAHMDLMRRA